jgi:hypothetical protein
MGIALYSLVAVDLLTILTTVAHLLFELEQVRSYILEQDAADGQFRSRHEPHG